jgi:uncharacterized protein (DUF2126 family)
MKNFRRALFFALGTFLVAEVQALDSASDEALTQTQQLLTDPSKRAKAIENDTAAKQADQNARSLGVTQANTEEIYALTADIMATLVKDSDGDPVKLQATVQEALKNPEAFRSKLTPAQIQRIKGLAQRIDAEKTKKP